MRPIIRELISCITVSGNSKDRKFFCRSLEHQGSGKIFFRKGLALATTRVCTEGVCWRFLAILGVGSHNDTQSIFCRVSTPATLAFLILLVTLLMVFNSLRCICDLCYVKVLCHYCNLPIC